MAAPTGLLFVDSFDHYNTTTGMQAKYIGIPQTPNFVTGRSGSGQALNFSVANGIPSLTFGWEYNDLCIGVAYKTGSFTNGIISVSNIRGGITLNLQHVGDGRLFIQWPFNYSSAPLAGFAMALNTWYYFEFRMTLTPGVHFTWEVRINGSTAGTDTVNTIKTLGWANFTLGAPGGGNTCTVDDLYVTDGTFLGEANWFCIYANAPGDTTTWTASPAVANWNNVKEHAPDFFTTYNQADVVGNQDLYNMDDIGSYQVIGAHALNCSTKIAAGVASMDGSIKTNATLVQEPEFFPSFGSWLYQRKGYEINPVTGVAWTAADINAIQRGALRIS